MNLTNIKYEDWFECLLLVKPKLLLVLPPEEEFGGPDAIDLRSLEEYDFYLKKIFEAESKEKIGTDFLEQALEYWLEERDKLVTEFKDGKMDGLDSPESINLAKEILYYDRAIKITIDKYLENVNKSRGKGKRLLLKDLPKPAIGWAPHFGMKVLSKFCDDDTPEVGDSYLRECFQKDISRKQVTPKKKTKPKGKGGRPKDPKVEKSRKELYKRYYHLTETDGLKRRKAIEILEKEFPWKYTTIEKYIK